MMMINSVQYYIYLSCLNDDGEKTVLCGFISTPQRIVCCRLTPGKQTKNQKINACNVQWKNHHGDDK